MANQRKVEAEFEHEASREPALGYDEGSRFSYVGCLEHGFPNSLVRWHYHAEYELHLIVATCGKAFIGDYIGTFEPGHLVLTGPRLPHNWISTVAPRESVPLRDIVMQFHDTPFRQAAAGIPELREALPLLDRAHYGIEFFGLSQRVYDGYQRIKECRGLRRFGEFVDLLVELARCTDFRLLSSVQLQGSDHDAMTRISRALDYINDHYMRELSMSELCDQAGMTPSQFSRCFRRATGNTFTDFVNRMRISRACQLLMETNRYVVNICYDVGFNNVANFNRRFLQFKGMTPKDFRRQAESRFGRAARVTE